MEDVPAELERVGLIRAKGRKERGDGLFLVGDERHGFETEQAQPIGKAAAFGGRDASRGDDDRAKCAIAIAIDNRGVVELRDFQRGILTRLGGDRLAPLGNLILPAD